MKSPYRIAPLAPLALLFLFAAGCASNHVGPSGTATGAVTHVVIMWMNDPSDEAGRDEILAAGRKLETLPGVVRVSGGRMLRSTRPVVDNSYDVAFAMTFRSADDMQRYLANPVHQDLKANVLDRYVKKYLVYDFVAE